MTHRKKISYFHGIPSQNELSLEGNELDFKRKIVRVFGMAVFLVMKIFNMK